VTAANGKIPYGGDRNIQRQIEHRKARVS